MTLTHDESARAAWLAGDYAPETLVESLTLADPEIDDWLQDHGIDDAKDLQRLVDDADKAREDLEEAQGRIEDLQALLRDAMALMPVVDEDCAEWAVRALEAA